MAFDIFNLLVGPAEQGTSKLPEGSRLGFIDDENSKKAYEELATAAFGRYEETVDPSWLIDHNGVELPEQEYSPLGGRAIGLFATTNTLLSGVVVDGFHKIGIAESEGGEILFTAWELVLRSLASINRVREKKVEHPVEYPGQELIRLLCNNACQMQGMDDIAISIIMNLQCKPALLNLYRSLGFETIEPYADEPYRNNDLIPMRNIVLQNNSWNDIHQV